MQDHDGRADTGAPAADGRAPRKDRPPLGRFLLGFVGLLAAALSLAALSPAAPEPDRAERPATLGAAPGAPAD